MTNSKALEALNEIETTEHTTYNPNIDEYVSVSVFSVGDERFSTIRLALTELEAVKKRAEEKKAELLERAERLKALMGNKAILPSTLVIIETIDYILKGETK